MRWSMASSRSRPRASACRVDNGGTTLGWLHLVPGDRLGVPRETRKVAIALGQQLGTALARPTGADTTA